MFAILCWAAESAMQSAPAWCSCCRKIYGSPVTIPGSAVAIFWVLLIAYCGYGTFRRLFSRMMVALRRPAPQQASQ
jgi:hypothetical protein